MPTTTTRDAGPVAQLRQLLFQRIAARGGATVDAHHREIGEGRSEMFFQAFGADTLRLQRQAAAGRACQRCRLPCTAVMALQASATAMHGHRCIAAVARRGPATVVAQQHRRIAAAVLEHQHLLATLQVLADAGQHIGR
ncbi:hypothetical protein G6F22_016429 [Rhizopus arrhizus]|nr:hypothetical protein G6F22_016429 [Rhizopus arrhizus]